MPVLPFRMSSIDDAERTAQSWLRAIALQLGGDTDAAYLGLRAVLHLIRDHLPLPEALALGAQLPLLIRGIYYEAWRPQSPPLRARHVEEFLGMLERALADAPARPDPQQVADAVLEQLRARLAPAGLERLMPALPAGLRLMFTAVASRPGGASPADPAVRSALG